LGGLPKRRGFLGEAFPGTGLEGLNFPRGILFQFTYWAFGVFRVFGSPGGPFLNSGVEGDFPWFNAFIWPPRGVEFGGLFSWCHTIAGVIKELGVEGGFTPFFLELAF